MPLIDHVQDRIPTQRLVNLTNDDRSANTIDLVLLQDAVDDTEAAFQIFSGVAYDDTDSRHIRMGISGVILHLLAFKGESRYEAKLKEWQDQMHKIFRMVAGNNRIRPKSSSKLTPSEIPPGVEVRPFFDNETFEDFVPESNARFDPHNGSVVP